MTLMTESDLPLERIGRGKVRDVYAVDAERLLLVATDRVSAFDVVMREAVPRKGAVLTQMSAWWCKQLEGDVAHHMIARGCRRDRARRARTEGPGAATRRARHALPAHERSFPSNASYEVIFRARRGRNTRRAAPWPVSGWRRA